MAATDGRGADPRPRRTASSTSSCSDFPISVTSGRAGPACRPETARPAGHTPRRDVQDGPHKRAVRIVTGESCVGHGTKRPASTVVGTTRGPVPARSRRLTRHSDCHHGRCRARARSHDSSDGPTVEGGRFVRRQPRRRPDAAVSEPGEAGELAPALDPARGAVDRPTSPVGRPTGRGSAPHSTLAGRIFSDVVVQRLRGPRQRAAGPGRL